MVFYDMYVLPYLRRLELAFWRYPWITFAVFAMCDFWFIYFVVVYMTGVFKAGVVITLIVLLLSSHLSIQQGLKTKASQRGEIKLTS